MLPAPLSRDSLTSTVWLAGWLAGWHAVLSPGCCHCPLQEENAELRRQVGESRAQQLERTVAAAREQLEDVRRAHGGKRIGEKGHPQGQEGGREQRHPHLTACVPFCHAFPFAELEQHAFMLDQQAEQLAEQLLLAKRGSGPRLQQQQPPGFKPPPPHRA